MAITPSILVSQSAQSPSIVTIADNSTGVDALIIERRISISNSAGEYLTGDGIVNYTIWPYADTNISLDILDEDAAVDILVEWMYAGGIAQYTYTNQYCLAQFNKVFLYYLVQQQGLKPGIIQDTNYWSNLAIFWANLRGAINAVETGADIDASQECLDRCTYMEQNQNDFF